jgi:hypothetical protein
MGLHLKAAICPEIAAQGGEDYEKFCFVKWLVGCGPCACRPPIAFRRRGRGAFQVGCSIPLEISRCANRRGVKHDRSAAVARHRDALHSERATGPRQRSRSTRAPRGLALAEASARCAWSWARSGRGGPTILRWRRQDFRVARDGRRSRERLRPRRTDGLTKPAQRRGRMNAESHQHDGEASRDAAEAQQDLKNRRYDPNIIRIGRVVDNGECVAAVHVRIAKGRPAPHQLAHFSRCKREAELHGGFPGDLDLSRTQHALHVLRFIAGRRLARTAFPHALEFDGAGVRIGDESCGSSHAEKVMARARNQGIAAKARNDGP